MNNTMVREIRGAKINPKSSFKNSGAQNTRGRKLREQIRYVQSYFILDIIQGRTGASDANGHDSIWSWPSREDFEAKADSQRNAERPRLGLLIFPPWRWAVAHSKRRYRYPWTLLTYSMEQSPSWDANGFSASQEIPRILWNPKVHYRIHKCPPRH